MSTAVDLALLHAPSVYDYREKTILSGPVSDLIPSTPVFEMYPIGFNTIANYLEKNGKKVRIVNLAYHMLKDNAFSVEKFIKKIHPKAFGIDLHWLPHVHGSIEIARIVKKLHPGIPVIFGGYSSTYFHKELIQYSEIDFIIRGDTTEPYMLQLLNSLDKKNSLSLIPNLTWKSSDGSPVFNPMIEPEGELNQYPINYNYIIKSVLRYFDFKSLIPTSEWLYYPITMVATCRGCVQNCIICGGSSYTCRNHFKRKIPAYRSPELVIKDILNISSFSKGPIFILGDLMQPGNEYADQFLNILKKKNIKIKNPVIFELFNPSPPGFFKQISRHFDHINIEISPESHDPVIRQKIGKHYDNQSLEENIHEALKAGCQKFDVFFMIGLSGQTRNSIYESIEYCHELIKKYGIKIKPFISPLAPFLDPGSIAFDHPQKYGYHIRFHTLEDYRSALTMPSWKETLSYETDWLTRDAIVEATYEAGLRLNRIKGELGQIDERTFRKTESRIRAAKEAISLLDGMLLSCHDPAERETKLVNLKKHINSLSLSTVCEKDEMKFSIFRNPFIISKLLNILFSKNSC